MRAHNHDRHLPRAFFAVFVLALPGLLAADRSEDPTRTPPQKVQPLTVAELEQKLKVGVFKLTESDVIDLLGRPAAVKRPGDAGSDLQMRWEYGTFIFATFADGKLTELSGGFSESLPIDRVNLSNFKRLRVGMIEPQVVEILGKSNATAKVGSGVIRSWGQTAALWVSFNDKGLAFNPGMQQSDAVSLPPGIQFPMFELPKQ